jgi:hypothetical protein
LAITPGEYFATDQPPGIGKKEFWHEIADTDFAAPSITAYR